MTSNGYREEGVRSFSERDCRLLLNGHVADWRISFRSVGLSASGVPNSAYDRAWNNNSRTLREAGASTHGQSTLEVLQAQSDLQK